MDLLKQAVCNELRCALKRWGDLNEALEHNQPVDKSEYISLRLKIQNLERRLDVIASQEVA